MRTWQSYSHRRSAKVELNEAEGFCDAMENIIPERTPDLKALLLLLILSYLLIY